MNTAVTRTALATLRRGLLLRIIAAALAVAALIGGVEYYAQIEQVDAATVRRAKTEAELFGALLDSARPAVAMQRLLDQRAGRSRDHFVFAELYEPDRTMIAEVEAKSFSELEERLDRTAHQFPDPGGHWYRRLTLDGRTLIQAVLPLAGDGRTLDGYFEGVFQVSPATMTEVRGSALHAAAMAVLGVLAMAAVVYPIAARQQQRLAESASGLLDANINTLKVLGNAVAKRDSDTHAHNYRVTLYSARIGEAMGLDAETMRDLIKGAFVHDVGKIGITDAILLKPGKLTEDEFAVMKTHVSHGDDIVSRAGWLEGARQVVLRHHEKVDGSGYPDGLAEDDIPVTARVFAVADVFDALTSRRPYKEPFPLDKAFAILEEGRDRHFDGRILDAFLPMAESLHGDLAHLAEEDAEAAMDAMIARHFSTAV